MCFLDIVFPSEQPFLQPEHTSVSVERARKSQLSLHSQALRGDWGQWEQSLVPPQLRGSTPAQGGWLSTQTPRWPQQGKGCQHGIQARASNPALCQHWN